MNALVTFRAAALAAIRRQSISQEFGMYSSDLLELERSNDTISTPGVFARSSRPIVIAASESLAV
jgi:hypothetical protein